MCLQVAQQAKMNPLLHIVNLERTGNDKSLLMIALLPE